MTRKTLTTARYGLIFDDGSVEVVFAVALIQALSYCHVRPIRVTCFEGERAIAIDDSTLEFCWKRHLEIN